MFDFKPNNKNKKNNTDLESQSIKSEIEAELKKSEGHSETKSAPMPASDKIKIDPNDFKFHVMPEKFFGASYKKPLDTYKPEAQKKSPGIKKNIIIGSIIGIIVVGLLALAGWLLLKSIENPASPEPVVTTEPVNQNLVTEEESTSDNILPPEENFPSLVAEVCSPNNCDACTISECAQYPESCHVEDYCFLESDDFIDPEYCPDLVCVFGPVAEPEAEQKIVRSADFDSDGLTDVEEKIWGTDPANPDTDGDSYGDGEEILNFYSPLNNAGQKLVDSKLASNYINATYGYSLIYPTTWQTNLLYDSLDQVIFTSATGEFIQIIVQENIFGFTNIKDWYLNQNPSASNLNLAEILIGNWSGLKSPDDLNVYLLNNNYIYVISYNIGLKKELNYETTFELMLQSFQLFENPLE